MKASIDHVATALILEPWQPWMTRAACKGTRMEGPHGADWDDRDARNRCSTCPVLATCREWILAAPTRYDVGGIVAGLDETQRKGERVRRQQAAAREEHLDQVARHLSAVPDPGDADELTEALARDLVPALQRAVRDRDRAMVTTLLDPLDRRELEALTIVLAERAGLMSAVEAERIADRMSTSTPDTNS